MDTAIACVSVLLGDAAPAGCFSGARGYRFNADRSKDFTFQGVPRTRLQGVAHGQPPTAPRLYVEPSGWVKLALDVNERRYGRGGLNVWKNWNVSFHGLPTDKLASVLDQGLLPRGGRLNSGAQIARPAGRGRGQLAQRCIFTSPTIELAGMPLIYCPPSQMDHPLRPGTTIHVQVALQFRQQLQVGLSEYEGIRGNNIGEATWPRDLPFDRNFSNDAIEWYTDRPNSLVPTAVLVKVSANDPVAAVQARIARFRRQAQQAQQADQRLSRRAAHLRRQHRGKFSVEDIKCFLSTTSWGHCAAYPTCEHRLLSNKVTMGSKMFAAGILEESDNSADSDTEHDDGPAPDSDGSSTDEDCEEFTRRMLARAGNANAHARLGSRGSFGGGLAGSSSSSPSSSVRPLLPYSPFKLSDRERAAMVHPMEVRAAPPQPQAAKELAAAAAAAAAAVSAPGSRSASPSQEPPPLEFVSNNNNNGAASMHL